MRKCARLFIHHVAAEGSLIPVPYAVIGKSRLRLREIDLNRHEAIARVDQHALTIGNSSQSAVRSGFLHPGQTPRSDQLFPRRTLPCGSLASVLLDCGLRQRKSTERPRTAAKVQQSGAFMLVLLRGACPSPARQPFM